MTNDMIDVSEHNGIIDWEQVKQDGYQYAMIRMGYGSNMTSQDDYRYEENVRGCERVGIRWGAYLYSYALDSSQVQSEIDHAERLLSGKSPSMPIAYDMEDADNYKQNHGMPSDDQLVDFCFTWLQAIESKGYYVSLYANINWLTTKLDDPSLDRFDKWLAQWSDEPTYDSKFLMWQYSARGHVNGINGYTDLNLTYSDFNFIDGLYSGDTPDLVKFKIQWGDTLSGIAVKHNTTVQHLMKLNPDIKNADNIYVNQVIQVPKR